MEEQISQALSKVQSIICDVKKSIKSVSSPDQFLPNISDILSEIFILEVVFSVKQCPSPSDANLDEILGDDDIWWGSSQECMTYSEHDDPSDMCTII